MAKARASTGNLSTERQRRLQRSRDLAPRLELKLLWEVCWAFVWTQAHLHWLTSLIWSSGTHSSWGKQSGHQTHPATPAIDDWRQSAGRCPSPCSTSSFRPGLLSR